MNAPKVFWAAAIIGILALSAVLLAGQFAGNQAQAQSSRITGTIVLKDAETPGFSGSAVSLPGSTCNVIIRQCSNSTFFTSTPVNNDPAYKVPVLYRLPNTITFDRQATIGTPGITDITPGFPVMVSSDIGVIGINRGIPNNDPRVLTNSEYCNGIAYKNLNLTTQGNTFFIGWAYFFTDCVGSCGSDYITELFSQTYFTNAVGEGQALPLTSLTVTYSCT